MAEIWGEVFTRLEAKSDLTEPLASGVMAEILEGHAEEENIKKFLLLLKEKGESATDISLLVNQLFRYALPISIADRAVDLSLIHI